MLIDNVDNIERFGILSEFADMCQSLRGCEVFFYSNIFRSHQSSHTIFRIAQ